MDRLTLRAAVEVMERELPEMLDWQNMEEGAGDYGVPFYPQWGTDEPGAVWGAPLVAGCGMLYLEAARGGKVGISQEKLLAHATGAVEYLLKYQRASGFIDLKNFLPDSGPDTAFVLQVLCMVIELGRELAGRDQAWGAFLKRLELFVHKAATGMLVGGFGTPNHRWVVCSALAQAGALFGDIPVKGVIDSILAEGIDIDAEGFYLERSVSIYDAVSNRSLLLLADFYPEVAGKARAAARKNLELDLHLLHADGTAETALSHRQDYGTREVPLMQGACYLHSGMVEGNEVFLGAADWLWRKAKQCGVGYGVWFYYLLRKFGEVKGEVGKVPEDYSLYLPVNGLWRVRRGAMSASVLKGSTTIMSVVYGKAELAGVKMCQTYYGTGRFRADAMSVEGGKAVLRFEGKYRANRPGAFMPLGREIPNDLKKFWHETAGQRELRRQPYCTSMLEITEVEGGFDLHYKTLDGLDRVCAEVTFDFAPGGVWETGDMACKPRAGDEIFLQGGVGRMIYGADVIEIGEGAKGHRMWAMRDSELAPQHVRVTVAYETPVDEVLRVRCYRGVTGSRGQGDEGMRE